MKNLMFTTKHRGVFVGKVADEMDLTPTTLTNIKEARMVIRWRGGNGVQGIAAEGPTENCKLSSISDIDVLHDVTGVFPVSDAAAEKIWL